MVCIRNYLILLLVCIPFHGPSVDSVSMMESKLILTRTLTTFGILHHWLYYKGYTLRATLKTQFYSFAFAQPRNYALGFVVRIYVL
jgi:hypothetical protein